MELSHDVFIYIYIYVISKENELITYRETYTLDFIAAQSTVSKDMETS